MKINHIITEFVTPQAAAQDPALEREPNVDIIFFGEMPRDFTANTVAEALEAVLPREYPPGSSDTANSNVYRVVTEIAKHQGAVVTNKPLSVAQKLVKTFQTYGIKCKIDGSGLDEDITRRGFLQGAGAAAVAGAAGGTMAQQDYTPADIKIIIQGVEAYFALSSMEATTSKGVWGKERLKSALGTISKNPKGKKIIQDTWQRLRQQGLSQDIENDIWTDKFGGLLTKRVQRLEQLVEFNESAEQGVPEAARPPVAPDPQNYDSDWDYYNDRDADDMTDSDPADDMTDDESDDWFDESKEKVGNMDADAFDAALSRMKKLAGAGPLRTVYDPARRVYKNVPHAVQPAQQPKKAR
jgi:hypothetical protein